MCFCQSSGDEDQRSLGADAGAGDRGDGPGRRVSGGRGMGGAATVAVTHSRDNMMEDTAAPLSLSSALHCTFNFTPSGGMMGTFCAQLQLWEWVYKPCRFVIRAHRIF